MRVSARAPPRRSALVFSSWGETAGGGIVAVLPLNLYRAHDSTLRFGNVFPQCRRHGNQVVFTEGQMNSEIRTV